jgi:hypothetical protein
MNCNTLTLKNTGKEMDFELNLIITLIIAGIYLISSVSWFAYEMWIAPQQDCDDFNDEDVR